MESYLIELAETVISKSSFKDPADLVLRGILHGRKIYSPIDKTRVTGAVFAYYRWRGWLEERTPLREQIERAVQMAETFARDPERFSDGDLRAHAVPFWVGQEVNAKPAWFRSLQSEPKLWLRARPGTGPSLARKLGQCHAFGAGSLGDTLEYQGSEDLFRSPEFHTGDFEIQDLSSQAVGLLCDPQPGSTWWDACAGEGGKTLHLADLMRNKGLIWATDRASWRLQRLKRRAARAKVFNYRSALWRDESKPPIKTKFDGVLVDAPCSGTGTWQRNPHARWTTRPEDVKELAAVQQRLLSCGASAVKPGGKLVYAVCSLTNSETVKVTEAFEREFPDFLPLPISNPLVQGSTPRPRIIFWPDEFGGNGMFVAAWKRS